MTKPDLAAHFDAEDVPALRSEQMLALHELHSAWTTRQAALGVPFDPQGRPEGSDYNLHSYDLDASGAEEDDFAAAAEEIMSGAV